MKKEAIISALHHQLKGRDLYGQIASEYGCSLSYVSRVLTGVANYNQRLVDISIKILEKDKTKEATAINRVAQKLGF